jgi:5-methyltetrahydrofolate--homocysteine methyltransferase
MTLFGGIPSTVVMPGTSDADFEAYLDELFRAVAPGQRMVVGIADEVPPAAVFSRLQRIGERIEREGSLPLKAGDFRPVVPARAAAKSNAPAPAAAAGDAVFEAVRHDVFRGKHVDIRAHVRELIDAGVPASQVLERGLIHAITIVGDRMASGEAFIPEVLLAARAMAAAVDDLGPLLAASGEQERGKVLIGTVTGDMHDIGKNLVVTMLRGVGFEVRDLGINVARERFYQEIESFRPDVLGLSSLLTTTMMEMPAIINGVRQRPFDQRCKVIVGGAPVSEQFAAQIGADGYAANAVEAVRLVKRLIAAQPAALPA